MNKIRTKRTLSKKVRVTKNGKIMTSHQLRSGHLRRNKSKQALRRHSVPVQISKTISRSYKRLLGLE